MESRLLRHQQSCTLPARRLEPEPQRRRRGRRAARPRASPELGTHGEEALFASAGIVGGAPASGVFVFSLVLSAGSVGVGGERSPRQAPTWLFPPPAPSAPSRGSRTCAATGNGDRTRWPDTRGCPAPSSAREKWGSGASPRSHGLEGRDGRQWTLEERGCLLVHGRGRRRRERAECGLL